MGGTEGQGRRGKEGVGVAGEQGALGDGAEDDVGRRLERCVLRFDAKAAPETGWRFLVSKSMCPSPHKRACWKIDPPSPGARVRTRE